MEAELASEYDVIVLGTGLVESVVAAAAARIGKKVLHIDKNNYYGGQWASFTLQGVQEWVGEATTLPPDTLPTTDEVTLGEGERLVAVEQPNRAYFNVKQTWHVPEEVLVPDNSEEAESPSQDAAALDSVIEATAAATLEETEAEEKATPVTNTENSTTTEACAEVTATNSAAEETNATANKNQCSQNEVEANSSTRNDIVQPDTQQGEQIWSQQEMMKLSRKFNLDLAPKLLYSRGPLVELLISSNVARYTEFKCITRVLTWLAGHGSSGNGSDDGSLVAVPCSRSDVFTTSAISLVEKRLLMKFLEFCSNYEKHQDQLEEFIDKSFGEFLHSRRLTDNLIHFVTEAMAMVGVEESCRVGLEHTRLFLASLGRYGTTPFLFSMYGCGELPQAFCRLCAVFEGTYVLRKPVSHLILDTESNSCHGVVAEGQRFTCGHLVMSSHHAPSDYLGENGSRASLKYISRAVVLTDRSVMPHEKEQLTFLRLPATPACPRPVTVIEVGQGAGVCPQGLYCLQLTCWGSDAEEDLAPAVEKLMGRPGCPDPLWTLYFNQVDVSGCDLVTCCPTSLHLCPGPDSTLDYDGAITQAQNIFSQMFPTETFLPRAPDPEEIVFDNAGAEPKQGDDFGAEGEDERREGRVEESEEERGKSVGENEGKSEKGEDGEVGGKDKVRKDEGEDEEMELTHEDEGSNLKGEEEGKTESRSETGS